MPIWLWHANNATFSICADFNFFFQLALSMDPEELYGIVNNITSSPGEDDEQNNCLPSNDSETNLGLGQTLINTDPHTDEFSSMFTCIFPNISNPKFNLSLGNLQVQDSTQLPTTYYYYSSHNISFMY